MPINCYFECHFNVIVKDSRIEELRQLAIDTKSHLSKNVFKKLSIDTSKVMMTYRVYDGVREDFSQSVDMIESLLVSNLFEIDKKIIEFSIYDTKISHDANWLTKKSRH